MIVAGHHVLRAEVDERDYLGAPAAGNEGGIGAADAVRLGRGAECQGEQEK